MFSLALLLFRSSKCFYRMILSFIVTNQSIAEEEDVTGMNGRIVIADDEPITRMDIRDILEEANYNVVGEATDGFEAIEL
ncbi:response regulator, partial [Listeria monocytogenes]